MFCWSFSHWSALSNIQTFMKNTFMQFISVWPLCLSEISFTCSSVSPLKWSTINSRQALYFLLLAIHVKILFNLVFIFVFSKMGVSSAVFIYSLLAFIVLDFSYFAVKVIFEFRRILNIRVFRISKMKKWNPFYIFLFIE